MIWDKPFFYGPFLMLFHQKFSLWLSCQAQSVIVSFTLWRTYCALANHGHIRFILLCILLGGLSSIAWFSALMMPDIFAPLTVLCLYLLAFDQTLTRLNKLAIMTIGTLSIAVHLTHIPIAAGCLILISVFKFKAIRLALIPFCAALGLLVLSNIVAFNKPSFSPFGSVFMVARLATDGPGAKVLQRECPEKNWHLCQWLDRLPTDSDAFMWNGDGPVWSHPQGATGLAPEASEIVLLTLKNYPVETLQSALFNTTQQLWMIGLGDTLRPDWLDVSVVKGLGEFFPPRELEQYLASRQAAKTLEQIGTTLNPLYRSILLICLVLTIILSLRSWRQQNRKIFYLGMMILVSLLINAVACGALSKPHYRYQTRIVWLLLLVPALVLAGSTTQRQARSGLGRANTSQ
mgnify:CR=1 FL=1